MSSLSGRHGTKSVRSHHSKSSGHRRIRRSNGEEVVVKKPDIDELRRRRAEYFGRPHSERAKVIRPKIQDVTSTVTRTVSHVEHPRMRRKHKSTSSNSERKVRENHRRTEEYVYGPRPSEQSAQASRLPHHHDRKAQKDATITPPTRTHSKRSTRPSAVHTHSLPTVPEDELTPDDSVSVVAERQLSGSHRSSARCRPSLKRRSTAPRLESISERPGDPAPAVPSRRSSKRDSTLLGSAFRRHSTTSVPMGRRLVECLTCASDDVPSAKAAKLACGHQMCHDCLKRVFEMSVKDPAHMPPKCCTDEHIPLKHVERLFDVRFKMLWNRKYQEYKTKNRIYCPAPKCGQWIKPSHIYAYQGRKYAQCPRCKTKVCTLCNNKLHSSRECPQDPEIAKLVEQAKEKGWQRCSSCRAMVELKEGCNHMTCRCTAEFCMMCGAKWKTCDCPWFNYSNLPDPDRLNEMRIPEPIQIIYRRVFDAAMPRQPPPPPDPEAMRERTYAQEMEQRRRQERLDADLARRMQLASLMNPEDEPPAGPRVETWGLGNAAEHFMNDDFVQNAANVGMSTFGDATLGRRGERASVRRRRARQSEQNGGAGGLVPKFLGDESVLGVGPATQAERPSG